MIFLVPSGALFGFYFLKLFLRTYFENTKNTIVVFYELMFFCVFHVFGKKKNLKPNTLFLFLKTKIVLKNITLMLDYVKKKNQNSSFIFNDE